MKDAGGSDRKKAKILGSVSKKDFIDVLRREEGGVRATGKTEKDAVSSQMFVSFCTSAVVPHPDVSVCVCSCKGRCRGEACLDCSQR